MAYVDLHLHSTCSDGSDSPARVVERAAALGIAAIALTDHDTLGGVSEAAAAAERLGLGFVPAVEVSTHFSGREIHVLAYGVQPGHAAFEAFLAPVREGRATRATAILVRLRDLGFEIAMDDVAGSVGEHSVGRMHIALLLKQRGHTKTTQEGFDRYLNFGRPAYVPKPLPPTAEAITVIQAAGGLAVLAHPGLGKSTHKQLPKLLALPFDGIEAYHIAHTPAQTERFLHAAAERGLLITGGSDCHGTIKGAPEMGKVQTPIACYEALQARLASR
jgi:predicted metal-dependent phosphoesterase TrpH